jgi:hypothetical protein
MRLGEGDDERKLFERLEEARAENRKARHDGRCRRVMGRKVREGELSVKERAEDKKEIVMEKRS